MIICRQCGNECLHKWQKKFCSHSCAMQYRHANKSEYSDYFEKLRKGASKRKKHSDPCLNCRKPTPEEFEIDVNLRKEGYKKFASNKEAYQEWLQMQSAREKSGSPQVWSRR